MSNNETFLNYLNKRFKENKEKVAVAKGDTATSRRVLNVRLPIKYKEAVRHLAIQDKVSMSDIFREAVKLYVNSKGIDIEKFDFNRYYFIN